MSSLWLRSSHGGYWCLVYGQVSSESTTGFSKNQGRGSPVMKTPRGKYFYDRWRLKISTNICDETDTARKKQDDIAI